jgi:DNA-binding response OmpR family regulator
MKDLQIKISVLIIENDLHELQIIGNSLKAFGHDLLYAVTATQAFKIFSEKHPDVILLNASIASANNYEFLSLISGQLPVTPVIIMASDATADLINAIQDYIWIDFVQKPLNIRKLLFRVHRHRETVFLRYKDSVTEILADPAMKFKRNVNSTFTAKILLVEDNALNRAYIIALLTRSGYDVMFAETGKDAIAKTKSYKPDIILLDIVLPDMNGATVLDQISVFGNEAPVIVLSGYSEKELRKAYPSISANAYLLKPVDSAELIGLIEKYSRPLVDNKLTAEKVLYDYSSILEIAESSGISFYEWLSKFMFTLNAGISHINSFITKASDELNPKIFHEMLNYCVYFGATDLKLMIWKFKEQEKEQAEINTILLMINKEIRSLLTFYERLAENKDLI